jgi:lysophospholipase L1-like esterase
MRKVFKKAICSALALFILLPAIMPCRAAEAQSRKIYYTALGDSIATGYRLSSTSKSYVSLFGKYLSADTVNLGQNGLTSEGLLTKLTSDQKVMASVKKSDIVTISIGGNDMLTVFSALKPDSISSLVSAVKEVQSSAMQAKFSAGVAQFSQTWAKIIARIKELSPNAVIIANTLINPYRGITVNVPFVMNFDLSAFADKFVTQINSVITGGAASGGYLVADSFTAFRSSGKTLTNASLSKLDFDPHPNADGHALIYSTHKALKFNFTHNAVALQGPDSVTIPYYSPAADARYSVKPLLSCFTASGVKYQTAYSLADADSTGATLDASTGILNVKRPGKVTINVTVSSEQLNFTATTTKTVTVAKATREQQETKIYLYAACAAAVLILAATTIILIRRKRRG